MQIGGRLQGRYLIARTNLERFCKSVGSDLSPAGPLRGYFLGGLRFKPKAEAPEAAPDLQPIARLHSGDIMGAMNMGATKSVIGHGGKSIRVAIGLGVAVLAAAVGCTRLDLTNHSRDSVELDSPDVQLSNYRNRKISIRVPPGNLNPKLSWQTLYPQMPNTTKKEFAAYANDPAGLKAAIEKKYQRALLKIARTPGVIAEMHKAGRLYGIDPILIFGTMIGEHSFNVGAADMGQDLIASWTSGWTKRFLMNSSDLETLLRSPQVSKDCDKHLSRSHADYWDCVAAAWNKYFKGNPNDGIEQDNMGFRTKFFNPVGVGMTYGLGQLDPIRALMVADIVNKTSGFKMVTISDPDGLYGAILDPISGVHYVAANITLYLQAYLEIANFDIRENVGVVASLYNFGREKSYARAKYNTNVANLSANPPRPIEPPMESYYGFFVNEKIGDLRRILEMNDNELRQFTRTGRLQ